MGYPRMKSPRQFLLCVSPEHAEFIDNLIMARLADVDGSKGSRWSGVHTNGAAYGVLWASPASSLFGVPITDDPTNGDKDLVIETEEIDKDGVSNWREYVPPAPESDDGL